MAKVYARDLKPEYQKDSFMGPGFEAAMKQAEENGNDLIVGEYYDKWEEN